MALARRYRSYHPYMKVHKRSQSKKSHLNVAKKLNEDEYNRLDNALSSLSGDIHEDERYEETQNQVAYSARNIKKNSHTFKDNIPAHKGSRSRIYTIHDIFSDHKTYRIDYDNLGQVRYVMEVFNLKLSACKKKLNKFIKLYGTDETSYNELSKGYRQDIDKRIAFYEKMLRIVTESALLNSNMDYYEFMQATSFVNRRLKSKGAEDLNVDDYNFYIDGEDDIPDNIENFSFDDEGEEQLNNDEGEAAYSDDEMNKFLAANIFDDDELNENDQSADDEKMEF